MAGKIEATNGQKTEEKSVKDMNRSSKDERG